MLYYTKVKRVFFKRKTEEAVYPACTFRCQELWTVNSAIFAKFMNIKDIQYCCIYRLSDFTESEGETGIEPKSVYLFY